MPAIDLRRPAVVTDDFRRRVADLLAPSGFAPRAKGDLVRRRGKNVHRVGFSSSQRNTEGHVACSVSLGFEDAAVRAQSPGWAAGGFLDGPEFDGSWQRSNIAVPGDADALADLVMKRLEFLELMESPETVLSETSRRYVPGLVEPRVIVPYLAVRLGRDAALSYARALLGGRPELWPAFAGACGRGNAPGGHADHGSQLATALADVEAVPPPAAPADVVPSADPRAAALRCFFGRQLRAWGEPEAAAALRRLPDADVHGSYAAQKAVEEPLVDSAAAARVVLRCVLGEDRIPRRPAPRPRLFQYHALHEPFA
ncbi:hypothetical protein [Anaeromyxobacter oryzae]|uniref:DUF4304 domain-containing protein n=1 Tax=Anaeromyxobacter oryzae TaxID=2918170 RepID=A0ABN6MRG5_9BACT|nr:hypothetical protein [Anaeromyxobacter oryzae]BDG02497.1 hypothetical protein AMOR_14930 [Anaeromyxobacter oryzae]